MRFRVVSLFALINLLVAACVDPEDPTLRGTVNVVVVDGTITNLVEPQVIRLNRSRADPLTGRPGSSPLTKAQVEVVVDSAQVVAAYETTDGMYQLPSDFRGQIGHAYQLRFTLSDGTRYVSSQQIMPAVPPIAGVSAQFNPNGLSPPIDGYYRADHDVFIDAQDPANERNYYRWDWKLWESQDWCRTCVQGRYSVYNVIVLRDPYNGLPYYQTGDSLLEDCFYPPPSQPGFGTDQINLGYFTYDYPCRTRCWAVLYSSALNVFSDEFSNGGLLTKRKVAQIPFYQHSPCLVEIRQAALTPAAYQFYQQLSNQTQQTGGVADSPPTVLPGNVHNVANRRELVVGVFTASAVATSRYWLDRKDTQGVIPPGLFEALNGRSPNPEPSPPNGPAFQIEVTQPPYPPYTAVCAPADNRTPFKPDGWRD